MLCSSEKNYEYSMVEFFKDIFEAAGARIKSPVLGMVGLAFLAFNWQALFFLFFADATAQERIDYFDTNTSTDSLIVNPLLFGTIIALVLPWLNFVSAFIVRIPIRMQRFMQEEESQKKRILAIQLSAEEFEEKARLEKLKAQLEEVEERRKIDAARRLEEASEISSDLVKEIDSDRKNDDELVKSKLRLLDPTSMVVLHFATTSAGGPFLIQDNILVSVFEKTRLRISEGHRGIALLETAVDRLVEQQFLKMSKQDYGEIHYEAKAHAYETLDELSNSLDMDHQFKLANAVIVSG